MSCYLLSSCAISIFSRVVPAEVGGRFMMQQLSGKPVSNVQFPECMPRRNFSVGEAKAFSLFIMMSSESGTSSLGKFMRSSRESVNFGAGFFPSRVPRFRSICRMLDDIFSSSFVWEAIAFAHFSMDSAICKMEEVIMFACSWTWT